jgi:DMSO/TMAO reductase YedYZ molybdopterin-dependent catalytic subunit
MNELSRSLHLSSKGCWRQCADTRVLGVAEAQSLQSAEYGFWANVNPEVPHARWSQASERELVDSSG